MLVLISLDMILKPSDIDNVGDDCPVFDGLFDYCSISAGGSMGRWRHLFESYC